MSSLIFTCSACLHIYEASITQGKTRYRIRSGAGSKIFMLLSDEQVCHTCEERLEKKVKEEKQVIQKETLYGNTNKV